MQFCYSLFRLAAGKYFSEEHIVNGKQTGCFSPFNSSVETVMIRYSPCMFRRRQDLESSASADAATREKISSLPPEVSDSSLLSRLQGQYTVTRYTHRYS